MRLSAAKRGYGARWQKTSRAYLAAHPLCVDPYQAHRARAVAATQTDHIVPHRGDMQLFWNHDNWQPLCAQCHSRKTAEEDGGFGRTYAKRVTLVFGAPGSGKTTYVRSHMSPGDLVWDLDVVTAAVTGLRLYQRTEGALRYVMAMRDAFYRAAALRGYCERVWIIDSRADLNEREALRREMDADVIVMDTAQDVCNQRVAKRI
ncbi:MAG: HNH endonuclease [Acidobacteriaceae bacterium]